jgi:nucleoside-diphosphate-sugar epimerase
VLEELAERYPDTLGMRFHTVYSDTPRKGMFLDKLLNNEIEYVTNHHRDFVHIEDICDAIEILIVKKHVNGIIDIGSGNPIKIRDLVPSAAIRLNTPHERTFTCANLEKMKTLGYKPKYNVENFLTNTNKGVILNIINPNGETR